MSLDYNENTDDIYHLSNDLAKNIHAKIYHYKHFARFSIKDMETLKNILVNRIAFCLSNFLIDSSPSSFYNHGLFIGTNVTDNKKEFDDYVSKINKKSITTLKESFKVNSKVNATLHIGVAKEGLIIKRTGLYIQLLIT